MAEWADDTIDRLRRLWDEGHSTIEIGRRLGVSKGAVVGKAHRMGLPRRPSPIKRSDPNVTTTHRKQPPPATGPTLPPLAIAPASKQPAAPTPRLPRPIQCAFPIGEPKAKNFRFCNRLAMIGSVYCKEHHELCHLTVRRGSADA